MYKLLLVDDERIIREGIKCMVDWTGLGISIQEAKNGLEAYDMIVNEIPHIVLTDIKMPGLNGLELIEKTKERFPDIVFVILSGYGEFDFASKAMQYGVKYYLLKPSNENEITDVLIKVIAELKEKIEKEEFINSIKSKLEKVMPQVKEQFLRDGLMNRFYQEDQIGTEIAQANYEHNARRNSVLIDSILKCIDENIQNEQLSLSWIAKEILYMNEDYLGKLFKKEMNENFCHYVKRVRMEKAKKLIEEVKDCKICEVAEQVGCGSNPQYFAQIFKKYTGYTPTEYKKLFE
ncbi:MAG: two-component system, response regulator YesN [Petroclostridium sp.]|jgi:two-component system response regulator YesN|uniref:response regulator transcription factor n=1 Tax=Petroclostridium xylanilyticum TaxID=1792311 RepID=UPI000B985167|nr:response regulator [Petroclostridium xylanilyticum]MBZ4645326.1 two component transcriptional regulator, AraC family [Clostridia bacterium]MDK2810358.1 two-component system, response regulator YesN [Petroclostridium sp.]